MLQRLGINVPANKVRTKNVAAVMLSADLPLTARAGSKIDVTVSSLGDAKSLEGGTLILSPLMGSDGEVYVMAQGPVSVGGFKAIAGEGDAIAQNYTLVGRVPSGGTVEAEPDAAEASTDRIDITLFRPDYTTASRVADALRAGLDGMDVEPLDPGLVRVSLPADTREAEIVGLVARVETTRVVPDVAAIVVINEKTGTIVAGDNVTIGPVAIAHGNLSIQIRSRPIISQPAPFSRVGETVVERDRYVEADIGEGRLVAIDEAASVSDVAGALNTLGVNPRDIIAIFQALKEAGALRAEIRII
jgi:flagellar P-ring protein precursor FlgI